MDVLLNLRPWVAFEFTTLETLLIHRLARGYYNTAALYQLLINVVINKILYDILYIDFTVRVVDKSSND